MPRGNREGGQATVELALLLPLLVLLLLAVIQIGLVASDRIAVEHVARVAARAAVTDPSPTSVTAAARKASDLDPTRLSVTVVAGETAGDPFTVRVSYRSPTDVALVGRLLGDVVFHDELRGVVG